MSIQSNDVVFVHIAKNAGRTISQSLLRNGHRNYENKPNLNGSGHATIWEMDENKSSAKLAFAILRDPEERFFSAYHSCFKDDEYNSIDECLDMTLKWTESPIWSPGVWEFNKHACTDIHEGFIYPRVPRAQYVPQHFYIDETVKLYTVKTLIDLQRDYWNIFGKRLTLGHIKDSSYNRSKLNEAQREKFNKIYKKDIELYEKVNNI